MAAGSVGGGGAVQSAVQAFYERGFRMRAIIKPVEDHERRQTTGGGDSKYSAISIVGAGVGGSVKIPVAAQRQSRVWIRAIGIVERV